MEIKDLLDKDGHTISMQKLEEIVTYIKSNS